LRAAISGVSRGSKLTVTISNSLPGVKLTPSSVLTSPLRIWLHSIGHS
jgi:hypothetical protein